MAYQLFRFPKQTAISSNLTLLAGAKAHFYATATLDPQDTYQDSGLSTEHENPVEADGAGVFPPIYLDPSRQYKLILKTSAGVTLYTADPVNDQLFSHPQTAAEAVIPLVPADTTYPADPWRDARRDAVSADGATDDKAKIQTAKTAAGGRPVVFPAATYALSAGLATTGPTNFMGAGKGVGVPKTEFKFDFDSGSSTAAWDVSAARADLDLEKLYVYNVAGPGGVPDSTSYGIGLKATNIPYQRLHHLWFSGFNVGMFVGGQLFYGDLNAINFTDNYSAGLEVTGALMNGATFRGGQFSRTVAGPGAYLHDIGSHGGFDGSWFELNGAEGANVAGFHTFRFNGCYFEGNDSYDLYIPNIYAYETANLTVSNGYFDAASALNLQRIRLAMTGVFMYCNKLHNGHFHDPATYPAIRVEDLRGYQGSVYIRNEYAGKYMTSVGATESASAHFFDSKHPQIYFSPGPPDGVLAHPGSIWINSDSATKYIFGWRTRLTGWIGTPPAITITATTSAASRVATLSAAVQPSLFTGYYIQIAGETFGGSSSAMVCEVRSDGTVVLDAAAATGVTTAAISYKQGTLETVYSSTDAVSGFDISVASGGSTQLLELNVPVGHKVVVTVDGIMGLATSDDLGTARTARIVFSNNAGTVGIGTAVYEGTADASGGAKSWTLTGSTPSSGVARVFAAQSTGSTCKFGFVARVVNHRAMADIV